MPRKSRNSQTRQPSYRHHKGTGQAVVTLNGRDHYLGAFGSHESRERYDRLIAEWLRGGRQPIPTPRDLVGRLTVNEIVAKYFAFAKTEYRRPDGSPTSELANIRGALRHLVRLYGSLVAAEFSPPQLKTVREEFIRAGWCRRSVNIATGRVKRIFKWAVAEGLLPGGVHHALSAVAGLRRGRSDAPESAPVRPVSRQDVDAILPYLSRQVAAMVELQYHTGMRPGEVIQMRPRDLDMSEAVWLYTPQSHKTQLYEKTRQIDIGPRGQDVLKAILNPFRKIDSDAFVFSPRDADEEYRARKRAGRQTPMTPSQRTRQAKKSPKRAPRKSYDVHSYRRAVRRACETGGIEPWTPNQLRHSAATRIRKRFGLDAARAVLGHSSPAVTEVYAEVDRGKSKQIMAEIG